MIYKIHPIRRFGNIIGTYTQIDDKQYHYIKDGVFILYPCGVKRWIMNSWYDD